jgi:hypothetical protein
VSSRLVVEPIPSAPTTKSSLEHLIELLAERFAMFAVPSLQMLCYLVPGATGQRSAGHRRVNWVC